MIQLLPCVNVGIYKKKKGDSSSKEEGQFFLLTDIFVFFLKLQITPVVPFKKVWKIDNIQNNSCEEMSLSDQ